MTDQPDNGLKPKEVLLAWIVALAADTIQIAGLPLFAEGAISPLDDILDIVTAVLLVRLLGWHWAFLPSLVAELMPGVNLFPTWTAAVWFVTRKSPLPDDMLVKKPRLVQREALSLEPEILPPGPAPSPNQ